MWTSQYFTLNELCHSATANRDGIDNMPRDTATLANLEALASRVLDPVRALAKGAVKVSSGYRSAALNKAVSGAANSQHLFGEAADIVPSGISCRALAEAIIAAGDIPFDQLILEHRQDAGAGFKVWLHISHKRALENRGEVLTAVGRRGRKMVYLKGLTSPGEAAFEGA